MLNGQPVITYYELPKPYVDDLPEIPVGIRTLYVEKNELLPTEFERICPIVESCFVQFMRTQVYDNLLGQVLINNRATSFSLFDMDLQYHEFKPTAACGNPDVCRVNRLFTLNRFNFDEMHKFLIPRAVAYSAGLLKHFFRGKLEISRPDTGFYFDVDSIANQSYTTVSLHVQNKTTEIMKEDILPIFQDMSGNFEVVARYTLPSNPNKEEVSISKHLENIPLKLKHLLKFHHLPY